MFERLHDELDGDSWLVGRVTGQEFAKGSAYSASASGGFHRHAWFARRDAKAYGVVLDAKGKISWGRADIGGDPIVVVLTEQVADAHLAGLRSEGVSYFFAGRTDLDLGLTLEILNRELGVKRLILEGGGVSNGAFLRAGLVDEISLILCPAIDGAKGAPSIFDSVEEIAGRSTPVRSMTLRAISSSRAERSGCATRCRTPERLVMREWNKDELHKIAEADDLHISPFREDGASYGTPTWIWSVAVDGALYVRGYNGQDSRWCRAATRQKAGRILAAGLTKEVTFEAIEGPINDLIDDAYRAKYRGSQYLEPMIGARARSATIKIMPRAANSCPRSQLTETS